MCKIIVYVRLNHVSILEFLSLGSEKIKLEFFQ
jgi:hypothetical protein